MQLLKKYKAWPLQAAVGQVCRVGTSFAVPSCILQIMTFMLLLEQQRTETWIFSRRHCPKLYPVPSWYSSSSFAPFCVAGSFKIDIQNLCHFKHSETFHVDITSQLMLACSRPLVWVKPPRHCWNPPKKLLLLLLFRTNPHPNLASPPLRKKPPSERQQRRRLHEHMLNVPQAWGGGTQSEGRNRMRERKR